MTSLRFLALTLSGVSIVACGGTTFDRGDGNGTSTEKDGGLAGTGGSQASTGGQASAGGRTGSTGGATSAGGTTPINTGGVPSAGGITGAGGSTGAGGATVCCAAYPTCKPGDYEISGPDACPGAGANCYQATMCCSTIWCAALNPQCSARPACNPGDRQLTGSCPPEYPCYQVSACGLTIDCLALTDGGPTIPADASSIACNPDAEFDRHYVSKSEKECMLIDYVCPEQTKYFSNTCGCGCEQSGTCPEYADCMPGPGTPNVFCTNEGQAMCPYTKRAF